MRVAIMQPTYMPWLGYFALADQVDHFIFLDDVEYSHQSWQCRNRLKGGGGAFWLSVPVKTKGRSGQNICDVPVLKEQPWARKHLSSILQNYARAPYLAESRDWLEDFYGREWEQLFQLTETLIRDISEVLGLRVDMTSSSSIRTSDDKQERLVDICRALGATEYISPIGSYGYLGEGKELVSAGIAVSYLHFEHPEYAQLNGEFVSHLSVLDLLFNEGSSSLSVIRSGLHDPYSPTEMADVLDS